MSPRSLPPSSVRARRCSCTAPRVSNRSGVVIARALMEMSRSAPEAIELVRRGRGPSVDGFPALGNEAFVEWLNAEDR
jgi:hypothetical protein